MPEKLVLLKLSDLPGFQIINETITVLEKTFFCNCRISVFDFFQTCSFWRHAKKKYERLFPKNMLHLEKRINRKIHVSTDYFKNSCTILLELGQVECSHLNEFSLTSNHANISSGDQN